MLEFNAYLAPHEGDGLTPQTAYRSILHQFIHVPAGEWFDEIDNPARLSSIVFCFAEPVTHQAIQADPRVVRLLPVVSVTRAQIGANYDTPIVSLYPPGELVSIKAALEAVGINTAPATGATTVRAFLRYCVRHCIVSQRMIDGSAGMGDRIAFLLRNLDATVGSIPVAQRNAARDWMTARGLATTWITGTTTIRQVLHYIQNNWEFPPVSLAGIEVW